MVRVSRSRRRLVVDVARLAYSRSTMPVSALRCSRRRRSLIACDVDMTSRMAVTSPQPRQPPWPPVVA